MSKKSKAEREAWTTNFKCWVAADQVCYSRTSLWRDVLKQLSTFKMGLFCGFALCLFLLVLISYFVSL